MIKWLWTANGIILGIAVIILMVGLMTLIGSNPLTDRSGLLDGALEADDTQSNGNGLSESALVAMAKKYSTRFDPPKPKPKPKVDIKPKPKPKVDIKPKPEPKPKVDIKPKPKPEPKPVVPPPVFAIEATLMIGDYEGLAWIKEPKAKQPGLYAVGEKIDEYEITKVKHGVVEFSREKATFTLKVPEPKKTAMAPAPKAAAAAKPPTRKTTSTRSRRLRKPPSGAILDSGTTQN